MFCGKYTFVYWIWLACIVPFATSTRSETFHVSPLNITIEETACDLIKILGWDSILILTDPESKFGVHWEECDVIIASKIQEHTVCSNWSKSITWDMCNTTNVILDVSNSCLSSLMNQVSKLESNCQGALSIKSNWIILLREDLTVDQIRMMQIPLFNLLTVRQFRRQGDISVQTLVRIGDNYFMKAVDRRIKKDLYPNKECGLCGKELRVTTMPMLTCMNITKHNGTKIYSGFVKVTLDALRQALNFSLNQPPDEEWGVYRNQRWTGMIGQLDRAEADIAAACLTVSQARSQAVDFTKMILTEHVVVLLPMNNPDETKWQIYGQPYKVQVWMTILGSIFSGALLLYIISRFTHYLRETSTHSAELTSTHHPATVQTQTFQCAPDLPSTSQTLTDHTATDHHPSYNPNKANSHTEAQPASGFSSCCCCEYPDCNLKQMCAPHNIYQEEDSGLPFALWFTYGSAVGQGSILSSKSLTVRWFMSCWWLGCVILGATYSANLVAFLSTERYGPLYSTAEELAEQNQLKLGVVGRTALDDFFMGNNSHLNKLYQKIRDKIIEANQTDPQVLSKNPKEQIEKVSRGGYALIDTPGGVLGALDKHPHLTFIDFGLGTVLGRYAFAVQKNSVYKEMINSKLQSLMEQGFLNQWMKQHTSKFPKGVNTKVSAKRIRLTDCQGAFYMLIVVLGMATLILFMEMLWYKRQLILAGVRLMAYQCKRGCIKDSTKKYKKKGKTTQQATNTVVQQVP